MSLIGHCKRCKADVVLSLLDSRLTVNALLCDACLHAKKPEAESEPSQREGESLPVVLDEDDGNIILGVKKDF